MKNKQENKAKPEKWQFFREMSLRYQSIAACELYTMFLRLMGPTFEKIIILLCNNSFCFPQENQSNSV
jgi:hypothetical protein